MMGAIWMRTRAELRSNWRAATALALMLGLAGGVVISSAAGARRTDSAYSRFLHWAHAPDAGLNVAASFGFAGVSPKEVRALPEVKASASSDGFIFVSTTPSGRYLFIGQGAGTASPSLRTLSFMGRPKVEEGRMFDPSRPNEVVVGWGTAHGAGLHPGDRVVFRFVRRGVNPEILNTVNDVSLVPKNDLAPPFTATVAGIVFFPGDVGDNSYGDVLFTPAFDREFHNRVADVPNLSVKLRHGAADADRFQHDVQRLAGQANVGSGSVAGTIGEINRSIHPQAVALWIFAALAAVASLLIFGPALARQIFLDSLDNGSLRALGMTRGQLLAVTLSRAAFIGVGAAGVAVAVAVGASSLLPIGLARVVEPHPGISVDALIVAAGALGLVALTIAFAAGPAWRAALVAGAWSDVGDTGTRTRPSFVAAALAKLGLAPTAVAGTRMALEPGRGRTAVPVRSALTGAALAVSALVAALTFAGSFQHLFDTPRLYGWNWDAAVGNPFVGDLSAQVLPKLSHEPYVGAVAAGNVLTPIDVLGPGGSVQVNTFGLDQIKGSVHPPLLSGRWPTSADEVALGTKTMRAIGAGLGSTVVLRVSERELRNVRVVGRAVFIDVSGTGLGEGAGITFQALRTLRPKIPENVFPVRFSSRSTREGAASSITRDFPGTIPEGSDEVSGLGDLRPVKGFPLLLALLLALAAVTTIAHTLVTSVRRRRRDLAILKTIGFVKRQVSATVAWQATVLTVIALGVGVPLGVAAGRWTWSAFADALGVVPESIVPLGSVLLAIPAALILANLAAFVPGRVAAHVRPGEALRAE